MAYLENPPAKQTDDPPCACHAEKTDDEKRARISDWMLAASVIAMLFSFARRK